MNATEARKIVEDGGILDEVRLNHIYELIKSRSLKGKSSTSIEDKNGTKAIIKRLKEQGYKCLFVSDQRDGDYWQVEW